MSVTTSEIVPSVSSESDLCSIPSLLIDFWFYPSSLSSNSTSHNSVVYSQYPFMTSIPSLPMSI